MPSKPWCRTSTRLAARMVAVNKWCSKNGCSKHIQRWYNMPKFQIYTVYMCIIHYMYMQRTIKNIISPATTLINWLWHVLIYNFSDEVDPPTWAVTDTAVAPSIHSIVSLTRNLHVLLFYNRFLIWFLRFFSYVLLFLLFSLSYIMSWKDYKCKKLRVYWLEDAKDMRHRGNHVFGRSQGWSRNCLPQ